MIGNKNNGHQPFCSQGLRLKKDISELNEFQKCNFNRSSASLSIEYQNVPNMKFSRLQLNISMWEGPYRGGHFVFTIDILESYPFKLPEIFSRYPLWHPNVEILTGRVHLPLEWSPVLSLKALALAIQLILLEPCASSPVNRYAGSVYESDPASFDIQIQTILCGGSFFGVYFEPCLTSARHKASSCKRKIAHDMCTASSNGGQDPEERGDMDLADDRVPVAVTHSSVKSCEFDSDCAMGGVRLEDLAIGEDSKSFGSMVMATGVKRPRLIGRSLGEANPSSFH